MGILVSGNFLTSEGVPYTSYYLKLHSFTYSYNTQILNLEFKAYLNRQSLNTLNNVPFQCKRQLYIDSKILDDSRFSIRQYIYYWIRSVCPESQFSNVLEPGQSSYVIPEDLNFLSTNIRKTDPFPVLVQIDNSIQLQNSTFMIENWGTSDELQVAKYDTQRVLY